MTKDLLVRAALVVALCLCAFALGRAWPSTALGAAAPDDRVFEIRLYTVGDGKVEALSRVFRDKVTPMFERHGMTNVAYLIPREEPRCRPSRQALSVAGSPPDAVPCSWSSDTLIYILGHASREAAEANWASFLEDTEGIRSFREDYAREGVQVLTIESAYLSATEYSALR